MSRFITPLIVAACCTGSAQAGLLEFDSSSRALFEKALMPVPNQYTASDWQSGAQALPVVRQGPYPVDIFAMNITSSAAIVNATDALTSPRQATLQIDFPKGNPNAFSANVFGLDAAWQATSGSVRIQAETNLGGLLVVNRSSSDPFVGFLASTDGEVITRITISGDPASPAVHTAVDDIRTGRQTVFQPYVIAVSGSGSGTCTPSTYGGVSVCTITAGPNYQLTAVSGCDGTPSTSSPYVISPLRGRCNVSAVFVNPNEPRIIPSLSNWGLGMLAFLAAVVGLRRIKRT
ncbi:IPTL-CTERM sorting domain-containing protein [Comamonas serinivorans]|uniref:IPTL-CTERM sorting domain-containing protein n=1 Tax=Comamonas serinivorans TaxID=1082851 RepID=UPI0012F9E132|nr:IPTL-CTERM sorting domain-containing protein [Comamonas serinivorans]